jgi:hypothetical protein
MSKSLIIHSAAALVASPQHSKRVQRKMSVTLVENQEIGGTCTNSRLYSFQISAGPKPNNAPMRCIWRINGFISGWESIQPERLFQQKDAVVSTLAPAHGKGAAVLQAEIIIGNRQAHLRKYALTFKTASGLVKKQADIILLADRPPTPVIPKMFPSSPAILTQHHRARFEVSAQPSGCSRWRVYRPANWPCAFHGLGCKVTLIEKEPRSSCDPARVRNGRNGASRSFEKPRHDGLDTHGS